MKKFVKAAALCLSLIVSLGACSAGDPYPELTDEQYEVVARYAASLLTRYNKGTSDKLTYLDTNYTPEYLMTESLSGFEREEMTAPDEGNTADTSAQPPAPDTPDQPEAPEPSVTPGAADTAVTPDAGAESSTPEDNTGQTDPAVPDDASANPDDAAGADPAAAQGEDGGAAVPAQAPVNYTDFESSGLQTLASNVRVEYTGYSVKSVYPDSQAQGAVAAAPGDKLLVVDFSVQNLTDVSVPFNTANRNPQFMLMINNDVQGFTMVTMIPNDLSGMDRELAPGERTDAVLLMEVPESLAKSVDTLDLIIKIRGEEEQTVKLE